MGTLIHRTGSVCQPTPMPSLVDPVVIAHVVNNAGYWGAGVSGAVGRAFPAAERAYRARHRGRYGVRGAEHLGHVVWTQVYPITAVAHLYAQDGIRPYGASGPVPFQLQAWTRCLDELAALCAHHGVRRVCLPYRIGAGLAGGDWDAILATLTQWAHDHPLQVELYHL